MKSVLTVRIALLFFVWSLALVGVAEFVVGYTSGHEVLTKIEIS